MITAGALLVLAWLLGRTIAPCPGCTGRRARRYFRRIKQSAREI